MFGNGVRVEGEDRAWWRRGLLQSWCGTQLVGSPHTWERERREGVHSRVLAIRKAADGAWGTARMKQALPLRSEVPRHGYGCQKTGSQHRSHECAQMVRCR